LLKETYIFFATPIQITLPEILISNSSNIVFVCECVGVGVKGTLTTFLLEAPNLNASLMYSSIVARNDGGGCKEDKPTNENRRNHHN